MRISEKGREERGWYILIYSWDFFCLLYSIYLPTNLYQNSHLFYPPESILFVSHVEVWELWWSRRSVCSLCGQRRKCSPPKQGMHIISMLGNPKTLLSNSEQSILFATMTLLKITIQEFLSCPLVFFYYMFVTRMEILKSAKMYSFHNKSSTLNEQFINCRAETKQYFVHFNI